MFVISFIYKPFMWCRPDARLRQDLFYFPLEASLQTLDRCILSYSRNAFYMNNLHACIMNFVYFVTDVMIIKYFGAWLPLVILYPCSWCLRVHSKVLTGLSLAIVLARFLPWRRALRRRPRNLRSVDSSLAKIGVILVSCSCGKWSPIDADEPQTASAINH